MTARGSRTDDVALSGLSKRQFLLTVVTVLAAVCAGASETAPVRRYVITVETGMPHLEENLRYATTREERCLVDVDLARAFPVLDRPSFANCALVPEGRDEDGLTYRLECSGEQPATGKAVWHVGPGLLRGRLDVKLGGKNMTLFQRVTVRTAGECTIREG